MAKELTAQERAIIQQAILDRWNPHRLTWKIANHFDLSVNQIHHIKSKAMRDLYDRVPDIRVALKLKILAQIRAEVGQDEAVERQPEAVGVDIPPRAQTYEEWLRQNRMAASG